MYLSNFWKFLTFSVCSNSWCPRNQPTNQKKNKMAATSGQIIYFKATCEKRINMFDAGSLR